MPKRFYDSTADMSTDRQISPPKIQKTERSHEENQERAYIAASRRADRSLEARVQSARMASEIHRKRTGRGLKVSEEIVQREEMYEEMEEDLPRSYRNLTAHLQTDSPEFNRRVSAYIASQTAMATIAKYNEVNRRFSEAFPQAATYAHQTQDSRYLSPLLKNTPVSPSLPEPTASPTNRKQSISAQSQSSVKDVMSEASPGQISTTFSAPSPDLSPVVTPTDTVQPGMPYHVPEAGFDDLPLDPQLAQDSTSSFTSELPNEVKVMADIDMSDPMAMHFYGNSASSAFASSGAYGGGALSLPQFGPNYYEGVPEDGITRFETSDRGGPENDVWEFFNPDTE
jgi:hypothetical protein